MVVRIKKPLTKAKLEKAELKLLAKRKKAKGFDAKKFAGKLKGVFGDPLTYQKKLRNEW
jgi:hypothetical protein